MQACAVHAPRRDLVWSVFNWAIWATALCAVCSQFLGIVWNSSVTNLQFKFGRSPFDPMMELPGFNDEAYSDRAIVCIKEVNAYVPKQLSKVLTDPNLARAVPNDPSIVDGYRVVKRDTMILSQEVSDSYMRVCDRVAFTLAAIQDSCGKLGYNVTREGLRIVDDITPTATTLDIPRALPILSLPYWDNALYGHYVIPSVDGTACDVSLDGVYLTPTLTFGLLRAVPRSVRMNRTETWLQKTAGKWRHGWYEDSEGTPWISNMATSKNGSWLGVTTRYFDTLKNEEMDAPPAEISVSTDTWGKAFTTRSETLQVDQAFVSNGRRFGLFFYSASSTSTTTNVYSLDTFISNISIILLLVRWFVGMAAMAHSFQKGVTTWQTTGIGCLSSSRTFNILPVMLLPRLKMTLAVFCTTGCAFEGQQRALSDAWYVMYPGSVEILFFYYAALNIVGKVTYRRFSDALFGPTLLLLWTLHYFRTEIAQKEWFGIHGRVTPVMTSDDVDALKLIDFLTTDAALRLNGNVSSLLYLKLAALALNLLPLLCGKKMTGAKSRSFAPCAIEVALALRASNIGGLGSSSVYAAFPRGDSGSHTEMVSNLVQEDGPSAPTISQLPKKRTLAVEVQSLSKPGQVQPVPSTQLLAQGSTHVLLSYELNRLGYLVFGGKFLLSYDDWYVLSSTAPLRVVERLWNYRISVFDVTKRDDGDWFEVAPHPRLRRLDEPELRAIPFYDVTLCSFR